MRHNVASQVFLFIVISACQSRRPTKIHVNTTSTSQDGTYFSKFGNTYFISRIKLSWIYAREYCSRLWENKGYLARIENSEQNALLFNETGRQSAWFGANDLETEGQWLWDDRCPFNYTNWKGLNPDNWHKNDDCAHWWVDEYIPAKNGKWNDAFCAFRKLFLCQKHTRCPSSIVASPPPAKHKTGEYVSTKSKKYFISSLPLSWTKSREFCSNLWDSNGYLARIENKKENEYIYNKVGKRNAWFGAYFPKEGHWEWDDGCDFGKTKLNGLFVNRKKDGDCAHLRSVDGQWSAAVCHKHYVFVCQNYTGCQTTT